MFSYPILLGTLCATLATSMPSINHYSHSPHSRLHPRASTNTSVCAGNSADDRSVWCDYSTSTNYYDEAPDTGVTVEYYFELTNITASPDGVSRDVLTVNGSIPGPTIEANWGDTVVIHVTNSLTANGTR